jgi:two-component system, OmpR family, alkaline phosphatase synthesis response regulator PhoP
LPTTGGTQRAAFQPGRGLALVLLLLEQPTLAEAVRQALDRGQCLARTARDACETAALLAEWQPHLAVVDMDVREGELLDCLRAAPNVVDRIPVIALTRQIDLQTKLWAFQRGVDDILTVPFSPEELIARALAILRRTYRDFVACPPRIRLGEFEIDTRHRRVRAGGAELLLTSVEHSLMYLLAANAGRLVTREQILDSLWGANYVAQSNVVDRHVCNLRTKLQHIWRRRPCIATVPGRGYRFIPATTDELPRA